VKCGAGSTLQTRVATYILRVSLQSWRKTLGVDAWALETIVFWRHVT
jgi:hypothetical protein